MQKIFILFTTLFFFATKSIAAPVVSASSGDWGNPLTWFGGAIPLPGDDVTIANGHIITVTADAACANVTIGNGALSLSTSLIINSGITLSVTGNINIIPPLVNTRDNSLSIGSGFVSCASLITTNSGGNTRRCMVDIGSGTLSCSSNLLLGNNTVRNKLAFSGSGLLQLGGNANTLASGQFTASTATVDYNGSINQDIIILPYYSLKCSGSGIKSLGANINLSGNLSIAGTAQLDVTAANNYSITVKGNWESTSTNPDPFLEQSGTVTFAGTFGTQIISNTSGNETFYTLTINNTAGNSTDIQLASDVSVTQEYNHSNGTLDLSGENLIVNSINNTGAFITCDLTGGKIITSIAGSQISFTDANDSTYVNFTGTDVGDAAHSIPLTINTGRINIEGLVLYGRGNFTKTYPLDDAVSSGGNKYHNDVTFTATSTASRWRFSTDDGALPDSFFAKATFNAFANGGTNNNFIIGANSVGNYYADSVWLTSTTIGGLFIGRQNGAASGTQSSHTFNGHVEVMVTLTGNITFADGKDTLPSFVTFNKTLKLNSTSTSTGDIFIGRNAAGSTITFSSTGQLVDGTITGATNIYFYNVTQNGTLPQSTVNAGASNSNITIGSSISPCTWNGSLTLTAPNINLAYSVFNGSSNTFNMNGTAANQNCTGGNTFAAGTTTYFANNGTMNWYLANTAPDDYNGNVVYARASTAGLFPAYNTNCTYSGNINIAPFTDSISFAANTNGRVTIDGSSNSFFSNTSSKGTTIKRLTINKSSGNFTLYKTIGIPANGNLTLTSGKIITGSTAMICLQDETCTITSATESSTSYIDGPMRFDVSNNSAQSIHFPIGKGTNCRPVQLDIRHNSATSYSYIAEVFNASANALGYTLPSVSMNNVSTAHYWDIERYTTSTMAPAPTANLTGNQTVALHYGANDNVTNPVAVTVCKNTYTATTAWVDIGGTGATVTAGSISSTSSPSAFTSFSRFTLGFYGTPSVPAANDTSRCGAGTITIRATPAAEESIDWYANATGGTALLTNSTTFTTPVISATAIYYAEARNVHGTVSTSRAAVTATVNYTPTVVSFAPSSAGLGESVVISGTDFTPATAVSFGGIAAASFTINSSTQITAVLGSGASGSVSVTNPCGSSNLPGFSYKYITTWTGATDNSWSNSANWNNGVPNNLYTTIIDNVPTPPQVSSNQSVKTLTVHGSASINIAVGNTISVLDSFVNNGTITGSGSISLSGTASQPVSGTGTLSNLIINNSNGAIVSSTVGTMLNITDKITPTAGVLTTNGNITLKSNASGTATVLAGSASGNYISGKMILERYIPARRAWRLITFPVTPSGVPTINEAVQENAGGNASSNPNPGYGTHITGGSIANGFDQNPAGNPSMKQLVSGSWQGIANTNQALTISNAYFLFVRGSRANNLSLGTAATPDNTTIRVNGNIKQGNQSVPVSGSGWQLVSNPFPSRINLDNIAVVNSSLINRNFVFWDPKLGGSNNVGGYVTASYNGIDYDFTPTPSSTLSQYAQPFSVFYVDALGSGTLTINETHKCNCGTDNIFRPVTQTGTSGSRIGINLVSKNTDGTTPVVDGVIAAFNERYSDGTDNFDALKLNNTMAENLSISKNNNRFAIERRKALTIYDTIFLDISNMRARKYQLEVKAENFGAGINAYIEDSYTNAKTPINLYEKSSYEFTIINHPLAYARNRFKIVLYNEKLAATSKPTAYRRPALQNLTENERNSNIQLLQNPVVNNTILLHIHSMKKGNYSIIISDESGKQLALKQFTHDGTDGIRKIDIKKILPKGILTATVNGNDASTVSFKILIP